MNLYEIGEKEIDGVMKMTLCLNLHPGQQKVWDTEKRLILALGGVQSGKTSIGPLWLWREICNRGPGDYLVASPSFQLMQTKALPEFQALFRDHLKLGSYRQNPTPVFTFSDDGYDRTFGKKLPRVKTNVFFRHAQDPESLESMTAKAAWLDEAGQKSFKESSWDAIRSRLALNQGRCLITTTPYYLGWLKYQIYDPWIAANKNHPEIEISQFESIENPSFPKEEYYKEREQLPDWKFRMRYKAEFTKPAGVIFDCFDTSTHTCQPFVIPSHWPRYLGLDFGGVNTAAVFIAEDPGSRLLYLYREYHAGNKSLKEHAYDIQGNEPKFAKVCGGAKSEDQWRREISQWGLFQVNGPVITDVEVGIQKIYAEFKLRNLIVFRNCYGYIDEVCKYSRKLNDLYQPTEEIDNKNDFHLIDASRYIISYLRCGDNKWIVPDASKIKGFGGGKEDWTMTRKWGGK